MADIVNTNISQKTQLDVNPVSFSCKIQTQEGLNERLFILTWTHSMHIFAEILFVKPENNT